MKKLRSSTKQVVITGLGCCLLFAGIPRMSAQTANPALTSDEERVHRTELSIQLRKKIEQADMAQKGGELENAARFYEEAYAKAQQIGVAAEADMQKVIAGLSHVLLQLARQAERAQEVIEAKKRVDRVLIIDPKNSAARGYSAHIEKVIKEQEGRVPSQEIRALAKDFQDKKVKNNTLVQDGKLLWQTGRLDEAEKKLIQAVQQDPSNETAFYYLNLVKEAKFAQESRKRGLTSKEKLVEVEKAWSPPIQGSSLPEANPYARTNTIHTGTGRQEIQRKLDRIIIDELRTDETGVQLSSIVTLLDEEARRRDPDKVGVNFIINSNLEKLSQPTAPQTPTLDAAGNPIVSTAPPIELPDLNNVVIKVRPALRHLRLSEAIDAVAKLAASPVKVSIEEYAVVFSHKPQQAEQPLLYSRYFRVDPNTFMQGLEGITSIYISGGNSTGGGGQGGFGGGGQTGGGGFGGQGGGGFGGQSGGSSSGGIPRVDVVYGASGGGGGFGGQGGGFGGGGGGFGGGGGGFGGQGGGGFGGQGGGQGGFGGALSSVTRPTPVDTVQQLVRQFFSAATGIYFGGTYSQFGQGGVGGLGAGGGLGGQFGAGGPGGAGSIGGQAARTLFFNDRTGVLYVRATMEELDIIEQAIQALNIAPPQVTLESKFVEITQDDTKGLGFDWYWGNTLIGNGNAGIQAGTAPSFSGTATTANPSGTFPTGVSGTTSTTDGLLTSGLTQNSQLPALGTISGILTDPQFRIVIRALEQRSGTDIMSAPRVTTLSGRQAQITVTMQRQIITSVSAGTGQGGATTATGSGTVQQAQALAVLQPSTIQVPTGPTLDIIPYVSADGFTIQMTMIPSIVDFMGYGNDDLPAAAAFENQIKAQASGQSTGVSSVVPLPRFLVRQVTTSATVWDGQTVVLGGLISDDIRRTKQKIPVLGDVPFLGRLFRSEQSSSSKKNLIVFVTATIIDPAGNRVHDENNLPYDPNTLPTRKSASTR